MDESKFTVGEDVVWNTVVSILIKPDSRLNQVQQEILAHDFGMVERCLRVNTRAPLVSYVLKAFNIDADKLDADPQAQQIVLANRQEIAPYFFKK
jgi:hypothetical protein